MKFNKIFFSVLFLLTFTFGYSQNNTSIKPVINAYIGLKDALVATSNEQAVLNATALVKALSAVNTADLNTATNNTWGKISNDLINAAKLIQASMTLVLKEINSLHYHLICIFLLRMLRMKYLFIISFVQWPTKAKAPIG